MSGVRKHLYTLSISKSIMSTITIFSPVCLLTLPPFPQLAALTGLKVAVPARSHEISIALFIYSLSVFYLWGARNNVKAIRTGALTGMTIYAIGAFLTCLLAPGLDGSVVMLATGMMESLFVGWMLLEKGVLAETKEFVEELACSKRQEKKE